MLSSKTTAEDTAISHTVKLPRKENLPYPFCKCMLDFTVNDSGIFCFCLFCFSQSEFNQKLIRIFNQNVATGSSGESNRLIRDLSNHLVCLIPCPFMTACLLAL